MIRPILCALVLAGCSPKPIPKPPTFWVLLLAEPSGAKAWIEKDGITCETWAALLRKNLSDATVVCGVDTIHSEMPDEAKP